MLAGIGAVSAQTSSVSFEGAGVVISLSFPEDAHPNDSINHTIAANTTVSTPLEIVLVVYAPVGSTHQLIANVSKSWDNLPVVGLPPYSVTFTLPQGANGRLRCILYGRTNQMADFMSFTFYSTYVRSVSYSELQSAYNELLTNHSKLMTDFENLLDEYDGLRSENIGLISSQETLLKDYNEIKANYSSLRSSFTSLQNEVNVKNSSYNGLLADYNSLAFNHSSLQGNYTSLESLVANIQQSIKDSEAAVNGDRVIMIILIATIAGLIALIAYVRRKKQEPYLVIRKETVTLDKDNP